MWNKLRWVIRRVFYRYSVVQFRNGKWAVRKWDYFFMCYRYMDLHHPEFWWSPECFHFECCLSDTKEEALWHFYGIKHRPMDAVYQERVL